jgi:hypothetical protein
MEILLMYFTSTNAEASSQTIKNWAWQYATVTPAMQEE